MLTGLVVGKFCPLHRGHEALIAFARARCDRLVILSYTKPEFPGFPPERRAAWLAALYPDTIRLVLDDAALAAFAARTGRALAVLPANDALEVEHRSFVAWVCREMLGLTVDRVFTSEDYGDGFAASLARHFGHPVRHIAFDIARRAVPISATRLRTEAALGRTFLSETVRTSLVRRVALIGGESSGKTTLAGALARALETVWVAEYGRELWEMRGGQFVREDLLAIAREQVRREEGALANANGWLVCDTSPLVTQFYCEEMFGYAGPDLLALAKRPYDAILLCAPDFPFVQDGTRRDDAFRQFQDDWYRKALTGAGVPFHLLAGSPQARLNTALRCLLSDPVS